MDPRDRVLDRQQARSFRERARQEGRRFVFTNGCFDLLHPGHVLYLEEARKLGDLLLVGLNSDHSVRLLKGPNRPFLAQEERALLLASLRSVDAVTVFDEETPRELIAELLPDLLVKGGDYRPEEMVGRGEVEAAGGRVVIVPFFPGHSSSDLLHRILERFPSS